MLHPPGFYYVKKPKRFVILSSDKSSERNLSCFFDVIKPRRMEHLQSEEHFSSDPYFRSKVKHLCTLKGRHVPRSENLGGASYNVEAKNLSGQVVRLEGHMSPLPPCFRHVAAVTADKLWALEVRK